MLFAAFSDDRHEVEDIFACGDRVAARVRHHGTYTGAYMGIPASGTHVSQAELHIIRLEHDTGSSIGASAVISVFCDRCNPPRRNQHGRRGQPERKR